MQSTLSKHKSQMKLKRASTFYSHNNHFSLFKWNNLSLVSLLDDEYGYVGHETYFYGKGSTSKLLGCLQCQLCYVLHWADSSIFQIPS